MNRNGNGTGYPLTGVSSDIVIEQADCRKRVRKGLQTIGNHFAAGDFTGAVIMAKEVNAMRVRIAEIDLEVFRAISASFTEACAQRMRSTDLPQFVSL